MSNNLQATQIVDKNGKLTTVYKNPDKSNSRNASSGLSQPPVIGTLSRVSQEVPIPAIGDSVELATYDFETSAIYEDVIAGENGAALSSFSEEYDDIDMRVPYLAGEDGVAAIARSVDSAPYNNNDVHSYEVKISMFDGNTGTYKYAEIPYSAGSGIKNAPTVGEVMTALVNDASTGEQYPLTPTGVRDFSSDYGFEKDEEDSDPYHDARETLKRCHEAAVKLKNLVGDVRYGDYVHGRYKAEYGYDSGITYLQ